jgi:hypothetical protein
MLPLFLSLDRVVRLHASLIQTYGGSPVRPGFRCRVHSSDWPGFRWPGFRCRVHSSDWHRVSKASTWNHSES